MKIVLRMDEFGFGQICDHLFKQINHYVNCTMGVFPEQFPSSSINSIRHLIRMW